MTRVTKGLCLYKNFDPKGLSASAPGLYTCIKTCFKDIFLKLATNGQSDKAFLLTSGFCPQTVVCPCPWAIYMWKNMKKINMYKIRIQRFVWNLQEMIEVIRAFCWHQKFVPKGFSALARGLYTCKTLKMCIKSDSEEIILKLATYGQREKAFLLSSTFVPNGLSAPARGYIHNWAATWQNQQNDCAPSKDSDQPGHLPSLNSLCCPHEESLGP